MSNIANGTCNRYNSYIINNQTFVQISTAYEGIPQNFAINIGAYVVLILLFLFLRKKAWNYGKLTWINKPISLVAATMRRDSQQNDDNVDEFQLSDDKNIDNNTSMTFYQKVLKFVPLFIKMSDEQLRKRCGSDAVIYCQFQRILMITVVVMMCFSLLIILPLNLNGGLDDKSSDFKTLTIGNVKSNNNTLWVHFSVAFCLMLFAFILSNRFMKNVDADSVGEISSTIIIQNVPLHCCNELLIKKHFNDAFPSIKVQRVQITHKVDKLISIHSEKISADEALEFCYKVIEQGGEPIMVVPHAFGRIIKCQCCKCESCIPVEGVKYYTDEVIRLSNQFVEEKAHAIDRHKLPIVFVTFGSVEQAMLVRRDYAYQNYCCLEKGPTRTSSISDELKASQWKVGFAPMPEDILWQNLHKRGLKWWIPVVLANLVVGIVVIILSTPSMVLNLINQFKLTQKLDQLSSPIIAQVAPSLILVLVNALMPTLIYQSDRLSGHWTNTSQNMAVMNKLYAVLVTTVLILPSLGLNSIPALLKWLFPSASSQSTIPDTFRWECIFMADGGALFCNYLISASFIGTALELLRFGELFLLSCQMCYSRSRAEDQSIIQKILWEFPFGLGYAWTLALFSMVSAYAVIVPIITPFGLAYLILKHLVDRYNLVHVNIPSEIRNSVHTNAAQLMQVGLVLTQATVTVYVTLRRGTTDALSICCYVAFVLGLLLTFGRTTTRWVMSMACFKYSFLKSVSEDTTDKPNKYETPQNAEEGFILVDNFRNSSFIPRQMTIDKPANVEELLRRKSSIASPTLVESSTIGFSNNGHE